MIGAPTVLRHGDSEPRDLTTNVRHDDGAIKDVPRALRHALGQPLDDADRLRWGDPDSRDSQRSIRHADTADHLNQVHCASWLDAPARDSLARIHHAEASLHFEDQRKLRWGQPPPRDNHTLSGWGVASHHSNLWRSGWRLPNPIETGNRIRWGPGGGGGPINWPLPDPPDPDPGAKPRIVVPRAVYMSNNTASVKRLPDETSINCFRIQANIDTDSWGWSFSLDVDFTGLQLLRPTVNGLRELQIDVNGVTFTAIIEGYRRNQVAGRSTFTVTGRSRSALLAPPIAQARSYVETSQRTAVQLAEQELVNTPWTLVWDTVSWLVPADVWSYNDLTPIEAISVIADAVGAVVTTDPETYTITVSPRYPVSPWQWSQQSPDLILTQLVATQISETWASKPDYNAVVVSGVNAGVIANVSRAGSAGDLSAPLVTDILITEAAAGQERARNILSDVGRQSIVGIQVPLLADEEPGLILPGTLVEMSDAGGDTWRGFCRSSNVSVDESESSGLTVFQQIQVERHHD